MTGREEFSCTAISNSYKSGHGALGFALGMSLRDQYGVFYNKANGLVWQFEDGTFLAQEPEDLEHRLMLLLWFAEVGPEGIANDQT